MSISNEEKEYIVFNIKGFFEHLKLEKRIKKVEKNIEEIIKMKKETECLLNFIKENPQLQSIIIEKNTHHKKNLQSTKSQDNIFSKTVQTKEKEKIKSKVTFQRPITPEITLKKKINKKQNTNKGVNDLGKSVDFSKIQIKKSTDNMLKDMKDSIKHEKLNENKLIKSTEKKSDFKKLTKNKSTENIKFPVKKHKIEKEKNDNKNSKHVVLKSKLSERPKTPEVNNIKKRRKNVTNVNLGKTSKKNKDNINFKESLVNEINKMENKNNEKEKEENNNNIINFENGSFGNKNNENKSNESIKVFNNGSFGSNNNNNTNKTSNKKVSNFEIKKNDLLINKEIKKFSNPKTTALYYLLNSGFFGIKSKIRYIFINKELYNNFNIKELLKQLLSDYENEYQKFTLIINKYDIKPFIPDDIMQNSLNFLNKEEEKKLSSNEQKIEIINIFKFLLLILGEDISKIEDKNIINYTFKDIYNKYNVNNIKDLVLKIALENLQKLKLEQIENIKSLINDKEDILSPAMLLRLNRSVSYMTFILRDFYNYLFLKTEDGTKLYEIRAGIQDYDNLGEKIKKLKSIL
jgi:hypothetical protein